MVDTLAKDYATVSGYLAPIRPRLVRVPEGALRHPFVDPSSVYRGQLWDWDSYFTVLAMVGHVDARRIARDCIDNFIDHMRADGSIPFVVGADGGPNETHRRHDSPLNSAKPILAQLALLGVSPGNPTWIERVLPALTAHVEHWEATQLHESGLFVWRSHRGSGADNHPGVYGRPLDSTAGIDLNCLFVREYQALAALCAELGQTDAAARWRGKADDLGERVRRRLWDPLLDDYFHADVLSTTPAGANQQVDWVVPLRFRSWVGFYALWAGVATAEQAAALVRSTFSTDDLACDFGVRTLSKREPLYNLAQTANPSNWQGPVWTMSNYVVFTGLMNYGRVAEAEQVLAGTLAMLARDIEATGGMHEYYDPETGDGLMNPGFLNWNLLATTMYERFMAEMKVESR
jgi:putative isomerase